MLSGLNLVEPRLGANAAGKSTLWEATFWCLEDYSIKGARTSDLLSWGQDKTEVLTEWEISGDIHTIYRSGPPRRIEINGKPATQEDIDKLVGLTRKQLLHSVIFGQGEDLFPDIPISERGELLDSVLRLEVWERGSKAATDKCTTLQKSLNEKEIVLSKTEGELLGLQTDKEIQDQIDTWESEQQDKINEVKKELHDWNNKQSVETSKIYLEKDKWKKEQEQRTEEKAHQLEDIDCQLMAAEGSLHDIGCTETAGKNEIKALEESLKSHEATLKELTDSYANIEAKKIYTVTEPKEFWSKNNICPQCKQSITDKLKHTHISELEDKEKELDSSLKAIDKHIRAETITVDDLRKTLNTTRNIVSETSTQKVVLEKEVSSLKKQLAQIEREARALVDEKNPYDEQERRLLAEKNPYEKQLEKLKAEKNPFSDLLGKNKKVRDNLEKKKETQSEEIKQVKSTIIANEYWKHGFKRIRLYFIQQILGALEIEIQSALSSLGLDSWSVSLSTESETKIGSVKLGVQIQVKSPQATGPWDSWSGGESQRLRLGIAMGFASLIQRASGVWFGWEVWDEPTQWLSDLGIEDLLQALQYRAESQSKSVWLIDHRALQFSGFKEIWMATKELSGSSIKLIANEA